MASSNPCCGASSRRWLPKPRAQAQQAAGDPAAAPTETVDEALWLGRRLVVAHNPERAAEQAAQRQGRIAELQARAQALSDKLDAQDEGQRSRGRALSDSGAKARFFHEVAQAHLAAGLCRRLEDGDVVAALCGHTRGLEACGVRIEEDEDTLSVHGMGAGGMPGGATAATHLDHRIAMSFLVAGMAAQKPISVDDASPILTSFPIFEGLMKDLGATLERG